MTSWLAELAFMGDEIRPRVLLEANAGRLARVEPLAMEVAPPAGTRVLSGLTLPGLANVHSNAFHRALRGRCQEPESGGSDFWGWRRRMYALAGFLDPEQYFELCRAALGEMALAGVAAVGEFHYLHHRPGGAPYSRPEMEEALVAAASEAGVRLTLLDTCYLRPGFGVDQLQGAARRFGDGTAAAWARRAERLVETDTLRRGAAIHSVRAVDPASMRQVGAWARERGAPLHLHLSEQPEENRDCLQATGMTPTELVQAAEVLGPGTTAIHAIHLSPEDVARLGSSETTVCACPTTERDLGDGVCPAAELARAGSRLCLGSDSNAVTDLFEEARALELDLRLVSHRRGGIAAQELLRAASGHGMAALGWDSGELCRGRLADFATLELQSPRLAGAGVADLVPRTVFGATAADVSSLVVGGREVVRDGHHLGLGSVAERLETALEALEPAWSRAVEEVTG